jgi:hypothetical protein
LVTLTTAAITAQACSLDPSSLILRRLRTRTILVAIAKPAEGIRAVTLIRIGKMPSTRFRWSGTLDARRTCRPRFHALVDK